MASGTSGSGEGGLIEEGSGAGERFEVSGSAGGVGSTEAAAVGMDVGCSVGGMELTGSEVDEEGRETGATGEGEGAF